MPRIKKIATGIINTGYGNINIHISDCICYGFVRRAMCFGPSVGRKGRRVSTFTDSKALF